MCGSTCFGRLSAHVREHTTALANLWFYRWRVAVKLEVASALYAPDDGRGGARNMLNHT